MNGQKSLEMQKQIQDIVDTRNSIERIQQSLVGKSTKNANLNKYKKNSKRRKQGHSIQSVLRAKNQIQREIPRLRRLAAEKEGQFQNLIRNLMQSE